MALPIGYLFSVGLIGFCTAVAVAAPRPPRTTPSYWGFWATFLINEQPFLALYLLVADTALAYGQGDLASAGGVVGLAVAVLAAGGLAVLIRRATLAGPVLRQALAEAGWGELPPRSVPWPQVLLAPWWVRRRDVARVRDLRYGEGGRQQRLDVYHRRDRPSGGPVLVFWHGGGFRSGDKSREGRALLTHLAGQGWVCISANYRLAPAAGFPDHLVDAKSAIAWARAHAGEYGGDPRTVVVAGSSAGAHQAAMAALTANDPAFQPGFEQADTSVAAAVCFYGYYGQVAGPGSSPLDRIAGTVPFLVIHGDLDSSTLVEDTREFVARLRDAGSRPVLYAELPGGQHTFDLMWSLRYSQVVTAVSAFCGRIRSAAEH